MEKLSENIIGELIALNLERMYRFQNARPFMKSGKCESLLVEMANQSEGFVMELEYLLKLYNGSVPEAVSQSLKDIDFNHAPIRSEQAILLMLSKHEQDALLKYETLLNKGDALDNNLFGKIRAQRGELLDSELKLTSMIQKA